jgi:hypothetical protein
MRRFLFSALILLFSAAIASAQVRWELNNLTLLNGDSIKVLGAPKLVETKMGKAMEFDGIDDGIVLETNPLANAEEFTVEMLFMPYEGGAFEQRYLHMQQDNDNRMLIELRSKNKDWFLDTFIKSAPSSATLFAENNLHPSGQWYHCALVYKNRVMTHFVNGVPELTKEVDYKIVTSGRTSIGVRLNNVCWYKGIIKTVKVTHKALAPSDFISKEAESLNSKK